MGKFFPGGSSRSTMLKNERYWRKEESNISLYANVIDAMEVLAVVSGVFAVIQWALVVRYIYWWATLVTTCVFCFVIAAALAVRGIAKIRMYRAIEHLDHRLSREREED